MNWYWPLSGEYPTSSTQGSFGVPNKYTFNSGINLYCEPGQVVCAVEDGVVISVEDFTGEAAVPPSPWWYNTKAISVEGKSGVVVYGEVQPLNYIAPGVKVKRGKIIGNVITILKKDNGLPMTMLHLELYKNSSKETVVWNLGEEQPDILLDPTEKILESN